MSDRIKAVSAWVFGVAVAVALAIGAQTALAQPVTSDCFYDPPWELGACSSNQQCYEMCVPYHGDDVIGQCSLGCCSCLL